MNVSKGNINVMILMLYEAPVLEYHPHLMKSYIPRDDSPRFRPGPGVSGRESEWSFSRYNLIW